MNKQNLPCNNTSVTCNNCNYGKYEERNNYGYVCTYNNEDVLDSEESVEMNYEDMGEIITD